jgi:hypothetical protein
MKTIFTALVVAAATMGVATTASLGAESVSVTGAIVMSAATDDQPLYLAAPQPGYIIYSGHTDALPGPNCYWTRLPVYDADRKVVGWRGRPAAVCPQVRVSAQAGPWR